MKNYICLLCLFCFTKCANVVSPTGGLKDLEPPKVLIANPSSPATSFNHKKIELEFNEFVQIKNIENIQISPLCEPGPTVLLKGKRLIIVPNCELDSLTTYTINFGNTIVDLNEGNILKNYKYVFSKNKSIDSLFVQTKSTDLYTGNAVDGALVCLTEELDSLRPIYYAYANEEGSCMIENVAFKDYFLYSFLDINSNFTYDIGELVSAPQKVSKLDQAFNMEMFKIKDVSLKRPKQIHRNAIYFEHDVLNDTIHILNSSGIWKRALHSSLFWFNEDLPKMIYSYQNSLDSISLTSRDSLGAFELQSPILIHDIYDSSKIVLETNCPIDSMLIGGFELKGVEQKSNPKIINPFRIELDIDTANINNLISLTVNKNSISSSCGISNDSTTFYLDFNRDNYGVLNLKIFSQKQNVIIELFNEAGVVRKLNAKESLSIKWLKPGNYKLRAFIDRNQNKEWDPGTVYPPRKSEEIKVYPNTINIKANWDLEFQIELTNEF
ncbi:Ig-like domain-containing protein [Flavobacteriales bacterium]|nr:Ig-like domain-containing protein [Flavobacteriales bacterium]